MISELHLQNIRNYKEAKFQFSPFTVIIGPNGRGKTNIIESLFFLSTGKSFRAACDKEMINFNQPFGRLRSGAIDVTLVDGPRLQKQLRIWGKPARILSILGHHPSVLFTPTSMQLVEGSPALRRQFIDIVLSQSDPMYARQLLEYQRVLKQRNELLHQILDQRSSAESLNLWNDLLVSAGVPIVKTRAKLQILMKEKIDELYHMISNVKEDVMDVSYSSSVDKGGDLDFDAAGAIEERFYERLAERRAAELAVGRTLIGPHRDDLLIHLNHKLAGIYGSRGEIRSCVVALKLFEYTYMKEQTETSPTLLFDDVFSEFDPTRRKAVLEVMPDAQMIFTATDKDHIGKLPSYAEVIQL